jgi:ankyrin repeat protein
MLVMNGANVNFMRAKDGFTPLMSSLHVRKTERTMLLLLLAGAEVNARREDGHTALSEPVARDHQFAAKWLIWRGADLSIETAKGSLMQLALAHRESTSMVDLLRQYGMKPETRHDPGGLDVPLMEAAKRGDLAVVERHLKSGVPAEIADSRYSHGTAMFHALWSHRFEVADLLLRDGADITIKLLRGKTALSCKPRGATTRTGV